MLLSNASAQHSRRIWIPCSSTIEKPTELLHGGRWPVRGAPRPALDRQQTILPNNKYQQIGPRHTFFRRFRAKPQKEAAASTAMTIDDGSGTPAINDSKSRLAP